MDVFPKNHDDRISLLHRMLSKVVEVQRQEVAAMLFGFAYFLCLLCSYYLLRPLRDAMGLIGGISHLQWLFTATFLSMLLLVPIFGAITTRWPPRRFVPLVYRFFAANILVFGASFATGVQEVIVSRIFFVWLSVFNLFVISVFWSVMADHFSNEQGRRLFGFLAAGGTAGALVGPVLAAVLVVKFGIVLLTVIAAVLLELAVQCFQRLIRATNFSAVMERDGQVKPVPERGVAHSRDDVAIGGGIFAGIILIVRQPYLLGIVLYMLLHTFASTFLYFEQARIVAASISNTASRMQFFALVDFAVSCLTIVLQILVTGRFIRRFGVTAALILLPVFGLIAFFGIALWPTLLILVSAQSIRRAIDYAIARPGREILFTVVNRAAKYKAKSVIETVVYRGGDAVSGWIFAGLAGVGIGFIGVAAISTPLTALWIALSVWLGRQQERQARDVALQKGDAYLANNDENVQMGADIKRGFE